MRFLRVVLALAFGLAMAGPDTQACNHHGSAHHKQTHSTVPQACCPADARVSIPTPPSTWTAAPLPFVVVDADAVRLPVPPAPALPPLRSRSSTSARLTRASTQPHRKTVTPSGGATCLLENRQHVPASWSPYSAAQGGEGRRRAARQ